MAHARRPESNYRAARGRIVRRIEAIVLIQNRSELRTPDPKNAGIRRLDIDRLRVNRATFVLDADLSGAGLVIVNGTSALIWSSRTNNRGAGEPLKSTRTPATEVGSFPSSSVGMTPDTGPIPEPNNVTAIPGVIPPDRYEAAFNTQSNRFAGAAEKTYRRMMLGACSNWVCSLLMVTTSPAGSVAAHREPPSILI